MSDSSSSIQLGKGQTVAASAILNEINAAENAIAAAQQRHALLYEGLGALVGADLVNEQWHLDLNTGLLTRQDGAPPAVAEGAPVEEPPPGHE